MILWSKEDGISNVKPDVLSGKLPPAHETLHLYQELRGNETLHLTAAWAIDAAPAT